jgi:predicted small lipoprotein YifL
VVSCVGIVLVTLAGCGGTPPEETPEAAVPPAPEQRTELRIEGVGFATPESVLYDPAADVYLVANINGSPSDEDDNGFISRLSPDGTLIELLWIDGQDEGVTLDAPKGMAIIGDTLYVADISRVRSFDRGRPRRLAPGLRQRREIYRRRCRGHGFGRGLCHQSGG